MRLLERAASCYEQGGLPLDAARCREQVGTPLAAARLYEQAGALEQAARCFEAAGEPARAVECHLRLGRPEEAAGCWERAGDRLAAGWVLVTAARRFQYARWLLDSDAAADPGRPRGDGRSLRRAVAIGLCAALADGSPAELVATLERAERELREVSPAAERGHALRWAVRAADSVGRHDLAARLFAAAYRAGDRTVLPRWREWARQALGGTAGIPTEPFRPARPGSNP